MSTAALATRKNLAQRPSPLVSSLTPSAAQPTSRTATLAQRAQANPHALAPVDVLDLQHTLGNQAVVRLLADRPSQSPRSAPGIATGGSPMAHPVVHPTVQMKLKVGAANDRFEWEADRVAEQVAHSAGGGTSQTRASRSSGAVQRTTPAVGAKGGPLGAGLESRIRSARGGGRPVPNDVLRSAEPALNADLSGVRVHADGSAQQLSQQLGARAFTHGRDIFLGAGQSMHDRRLMAHELTHTVHQGAAKPRPIAQRVPRAASHLAGAVPGIQRETDISSLSEQEKLAYQARTAKKVKGWQRATKVANYLNPLGLLDDITAIPFHIKDFFDFARTGKRRKTREREATGVENGTTAARRIGGLTGIRAYQNYLPYHKLAFGNGAPVNDPLDYKGINPFKLMARHTAKLRGKQRRVDQSLYKDTTDWEKLKRLG